MNALFPEKLRFLFRPARYKIAYGGRGGAKSWGFARALLVLGAARCLRILCAREIQKSIAESVHQLLQDQIKDLGLAAHYTVTDTEIRGANGTQILFAGLKHNITSIKSLEGADIVWVEEAQTVSDGSWKVLIPTIRKPGSEIWLSFNPELATDATYDRFILHPPPGAVVVYITFRDNPWFPDVLEGERKHLEETDPIQYANVWEGSCKSQVEGAIYANELAVVEREKRITRIPYDRARMVDCFWDLGYGDKTAIWMVQSFPFEFRLIDYLENERQPLSWYLAQLQSRGYVYGDDWLPWDLGMHAKLMNGGKSIEETMRSLGRRVRISPRGDKIQRIDYARDIFPRCWFDASRCADGLHALRHYRYGVIERNTLDSEHKAMTRAPLHDWTSHGADAFGYFAAAQVSGLGRKHGKPQRPGTPPAPPSGSRGWMA